MAFSHFIGDWFIVVVVQGLNRDRAEIQITDFTHQLFCSMLDENGDTEAAQPSRSSPAVVASPSLASILCPAEGLVLATADEPLFHEAGVWLPSLQLWLVTSNRLDGPRVRVSTIGLDGTVHDCSPQLEAAGFVMGNGGTADGQGGAFLCSQGLGTMGGSVWQLTPEAASSTGPPCFAAERLEVRCPGGVCTPFNSPNDVCFHRTSGCARIPSQRTCAHTCLHRCYTLVSARAPAQVHRLHRPELRPRARLPAWCRRPQYPRCRLHQLGVVPSAGARWAVGGARARPRLHQAQRMPAQPRRAHALRLRHGLL